MTVIGERPLRSDELSLKILPSTFTFDVTIKMRDAEATYDLEKGQCVTVKFVLTDAGGCILSYSGEQGIIIQ